MNLGESTGRTTKDKLRKAREELKELELETKRRESAVLNSRARERKKHTLRIWQSKIKRKNLTWISLKKQEKFV